LCGKDPVVKKELTETKDTKAEDSKGDSNNSSWQTQKKTKEVPEEVLRKVLE